MRAHYDFARMKSRKNPYVRLLKQSVTIRLDRDTVTYFKAMAGETGLPYQNLINLYLRDCATQGRKLSAEWVDDRVSEPRAAYHPKRRRIRKPR